MDVTGWVLTNAGYIAFCVFLVVCGIGIWVARP